MFNCRICTDSPLFSSLLGAFSSSPSQQSSLSMQGSVRKQHSNQRPSSTSSTASSSSSASSRRNFRKDPTTFVSRGMDDLKKMVVAWNSFVHPRAREFFPSHDLLLQVLTQISQGIHSEEDDPVLGSSAGEDKCVFWYGETTKDDPSQAAIRMVKPGESTESITFVNRVLVFIFATDDSFEQLMKLPKEPFKMTCGNQLCVCLNHISTTN